MLIGKVIATPRSYPGKMIVILPWFGIALKYGLLRSTAMSSQDIVCLSARNRGVDPYTYYRSDLDQSLRQIAALVVAALIHRPTKNLLEL